MYIVLYKNVNIKKNSIDANGNIYKIVLCLTDRKYLNT